MAGLDEASRLVEQAKRARGGKYAPNVQDFSEAQRAYLAWLEGERGDTVSEIVFARLRGDDTQRVIIESLILGECPPEEAEKALGIPVRAFSWYKELFFDTGTFLTALDRIAYLEGLSNEEERQLKLRAVDLGYAYVLYVYAHVVPDESRQFELLRRMYMSSAYKALSMNYTGMGGSVSRQAVEHARLMLQAFQAMDKSRPDNAGQGEALLRILTEQAPAMDSSTMEDDII